MAGSSRSQKIKVDVIWDFEGGWVHDKSTREALKQRIEASLKLVNDRYFVENITAVGPSYGEKARALAPLIGQTNIVPLHISEDNVRCGTEGCDNLAAFIPGKNDDELIMRTTDRADVLAMIKMYACVLSREKNILVITGDQDFLAPIVALTRFPTHTNVMVARSGATPSRRLCGKTTWIFEHMIMPGGCLPLQGQN
uniref:NYN domain-containing protein n=1 Tax=Noccaea caerulescens TaxID=107243 RepID=A0A1J3IXN1_NOCCA